MKAITAIESETLIVNESKDAEFVPMIEMQCGACFGILSIEQIFVQDNEITCPYCKNEMKIETLDNDDILTPKYDFQE